MFTELKEQEKSQVQLLRALCALHGWTVADLAERSGIPSENVQAFMTGATAAISDQGFATLFGLVGVTSDWKLDSGKVHFWQMKMSRIKNFRNLLPMSTARGLLGDHTAMALRPRGGVTTILIRTKESRIVLFVRTPKFYGLNVADLGLTPGAFDGNSKTDALPEYYYSLIERRSLRPNYFDLILNGTYVNESLDLLRMVALEHDVTLSELVSYVVRNDKRNQQNVSVEVSRESDTHAGEAVAAETGPTVLVFGSMNDLTRRQA